MDELNCRPDSLLTTHTPNLLTGPQTLPRFFYTRESWEYFFLDKAPPLSADQTESLSDGAVILSQGRVATMAGIADDKMCYLSRCAFQCTCCSGTLPNLGFLGNDSNCVLFQKLCSRPTYLPRTLKANGCQIGDCPLLMASVSKALLVQKGSLGRTWLLKETMSNATSYCVSQKTNQFYCCENSMELRQILPIQIRIYIHHP